MTIELRQNSVYCMLVPTSMGIRITSINGQPVHCSDTFQMYVTSAESNVWASRESSDDICQG
jgi:2-dehydro-3-deoxygluconokinase